MAEGHVVDKVHRAGLFHKMKYNFHFFLLALQTGWAKPHISLSNIS